MMHYVPKPREVKNPIYKGFCEFCGREFMSNKPFAKYCSDVCRVKQYNQNKPTQKNEKTQKITNFSKNDKYKEMKVRFGSTITYKGTNRIECREQLEETLKDVGILKKDEHLIIQGKNKNLRGELKYKVNSKEHGITMYYSKF